MTTLWKWILGIVVVLAVIVAVPLGMHLLVNNGYIAAPAMYAFHHGPVGPAFKTCRTDLMTGRVPADLSLAAAGCITDAASVSLAR